MPDKPLTPSSIRLPQVPDKPRVARPPSVQPAAAIRGYQVEAEMEALACGPGRLRPHTLRQLVRSQHDWRAVLLGVDPEGDRNVSLVLGEWRAARCQGPGPSTCSLVFHRDAHA